RTSCTTSVVGSLDQARDRPVSLSQSAQEVSAMHRVPACAVTPHRRAGAQTARKRRSESSRAATSATRQGGEGAKGHAESQNSRAVRGKSGGSAVQRK